jgi:GDP-L-fucose synthase
MKRLTRSSYPASPLLPSLYALSADGGRIGHEDDELSIKDVGDAIVKAVGYEGEYTVSSQLPGCGLDSRAKFDTSRADGQYRKPASNDKLMAAMADTGGFQFTPFDQGKPKLDDTS